MTKEEKLALIGQFEALSNAYNDTLVLEKDVILYRPFDDSWSITEHIIHCADFDTANFHRYCWAIVSPGKRVPSFNSNWTEALDYQLSGISSALDIIKSVRGFMADHLRRISGDDWTQYTYSFSEEKSFNLEEAVQHYNNHVGFHRDYIYRNIRLFREKRGNE